ncbi:MAG: hypothetical protein LIO79_06385 [Rikenellaceae bacterium]|nr:hypothetical protein [Rikenellaceae bacterium]
MVEFRGIDHRDTVLRDNSIWTDLNDDVPHVLLSTCNRTEVYWGEGDIPDNILRHLCRVASGLESAIPGETAILGLIKRAYSDASHKFRLSPEINKIFQTAVRAGKRVRSETKISNGAVSHSQAAVDIIRGLYPDLKNNLITIVGINKLTEDALRFLKTCGVSGLFLSNRKLSKAEERAKKYGCGAIPLSEKKKFMAFTDILICATSAPHIIIGPDDIPEDRNMTIIDLSFPSNIDPAVAEMTNVIYYDIRAVEAYVNRNISQRQDEIVRAEKIIEQEIKKYHAWNYARKRRINGTEIIASSL